MMPAISAVVLDDLDRPGRLVLVEDDPVAQEILAHVLRDAGHEVEVFGTLTAAREALAKAEPDLILVDVFLPDGLGLELVQELRSIPIHKLLPIIAITAFEISDVVADAFDAGADDLLHKPMQSAVLVHRVKTVLRAARTLIELAENRRTMANVQAAAGIATFVHDGEAHSFVHSPLMATLLGYPEGTHLTEPMIAAALDEAGREQFAEDVNFEPPSAVNRVLCLARPGLEGPRWIHVQGRADPDRPHLLFGTVHDVSGLRQAEDHIDRLRTHDPITGLLNKAGLERALTNMLADSETEADEVSVVAIALRELAQVQREAPGETSEAILRRIAARMATALAQRGQDPAGLVMARTLNSFMVAARGLGSREQLDALAQDLVEALNKPYRINDQEILLHACAGTATGLVSGVDAGRLQRNSLAALQTALDDRQRDVVGHVAGISQQIERRLRLEHDLTQGLRRGNIDVYFQPQVASSGRIERVEALIRWNHPDLGPIPAGTTVPMAERLGLADELDKFVLRQSCEAAARWRRAGFDIGVSVNIAAAYLTGIDLVQTVSSLLSELDLPPGLLEVEVTEGVIMSVDVASKRLSALRDLGIRIALDDFGTGHSSLARLTALPLDVVKIDRSFVLHLPEPKSVAVVETIIALARSMDLETVAEGVEDPGVADYLWDKGVDLIQGFLISPAVPEQNLLSLFRARNAAE